MLGGQEDIFLTCSSTSNIIRCTIGDSDNVGLPVVELYTNSQNKQAAKIYIMTLEGELKSPELSCGGNPASSHRLFNCVNPNDPSQPEIKLIVKSEKINVTILNKKGEIAQKMQKRKKRPR